MRNCRFVIVIGSSLAIQFAAEEPFASLLLIPSFESIPPTTHQVDCLA